MRDFWIIAAIIALILGGAKVWYIVQWHYFPTQSQQMERMFESGRKLQEQGEFAEAERQYMQAASLDPEHSELLEQMAVLYYQMKRYDRADTLLRKYLQTDVEPEDIFSAGTHFYLTGFLHGAEVCYKIIYADTPDDPLIQLGLARIYHDTDRPDSARFYYQQAINYGYEKQAVYLHLAYLFAERKQNVDSTRWYYNRYLSEGGAPQTVIEQWIHLNETR